MATSNVHQTHALARILSHTASKPSPAECNVHPWVPHVRTSVTFVVARYLPRLSRCRIPVGLPGWYLSCPWTHQRVHLLCLSLSTSSSGRSLPHPRTSELVQGWPLVQQLQRCAGCMCCRASFLMTSYRRISATKSYIHRSESAKTSADVRFSFQPLPTVSRINVSCSSGVSDQHDNHGAPRPTDDWVTGAGFALLFAEQHSLCPPPRAANVSITWTTPPCRRPYYYLNRSSMSALDGILELSCSSAQF
ncbi:hypothetical protein C8Q74DRAFT_1047885 [Fomes fomentarius]|nr:hypothetical protein C8Q74DRAFT_1047885 [Fomes fomentarius]